MSGSTQDRVKALFIEKLDLKEEALTPVATLESLGLDSLDKIEFMFNIEDEFHIKLPDERVEIKTIQDISGIVERLVAEQKPAS